MQASLHRRVQRYGWDRGADTYAMLWEPVLANCSRRVVSMVAPRPGESALDIACGPGAVTQLLAEGVGPTGKVLGTDLAAQMVRLATERMKRRGLTNARFARMDMEHLDLADESQDIVSCGLGLMYAADTDAALQEMLRVLRPGGRCVVAVWGRRDRCGWHEIFPIVDARVESEVCPLFFGLGAKEALVTAMTRAGFRDVREERRAENLHWPNDEAVCQAMFAGGPVALAYSRFDAATRETVHAEFLASVEPNREGEAWNIPGEFVYAVGHRQ